MKRVPASLREKAKTPSEAKERYRAFIQRTLACVDGTVQLFVGPSPLGSEDAVTLEPRNNPIRLTTQSGQVLYLRLSQQGEIIKDRRFRGEYRITTRSYHYALSTDQDCKEPLIVWDWHPGRSPDHPHPHIHVSMADPLGKGTRLHIPSGKRVTAEQIASFLIKDMNVVPAVPEWQEILGEHQLRYDMYQVQDQPPPSN